MDVPMEEASWSDFFVTFKVDLCLIVYSLFLLGKQLFSVVIVLPQFQSIFASMNVELPFITQLLLSLGSNTNQYWFLIIPMVFILTAMAVSKWTFWLKAKGFGPKGRDARVYSFTGLVALIIVVFILEYIGYVAIYMPMLKLVNSVG